MILRASKSNHRPKRTVPDVAPGAVAMAAGVVAMAVGAVAVAADAVAMAVGAVAVAAGAVATAVSAAAMANSAAAIAGRAAAQADFTRASSWIKELAGKRRSAPVVNLRRVPIETALGGGVSKLSLTGER